MIMNIWSIIKIMINMLDFMNNNLRFVVFLIVYQSVGELEKKNDFEVMFAIYFQF